MTLREKTGFKQTIPLRDPVISYQARGSVDQEENSDGSEKSVSFVQVHGICTYEKSLFVTGACTVRPNQFFNFLE